MGVELAGGEALTACARAGAAPTTAVVGAATAAALSSGIGVDLAVKEALTACTIVVAAWSRAELRAAIAVTSPPTLTIARGQAQEWFCLLSALASLHFLSRARLLSAQASLRFLSREHLFSLAGRCPGWHEGGDDFLHKKVSFFILPHTAHAPRHRCPCTPDRAPGDGW